MPRDSRIQRKKNNYFFGQMKRHKHETPDANSFVLFFSLIKNQIKIIVLQRTISAAAHCNRTEKHIIVFIGELAQREFIGVDKSI